MGTVEEAPERAVPLAVEIDVGDNFSVRPLAVVSVDVGDDIHARPRAAAIAGRYSGTGALPGPLSMLITTMPTFGAPLAEEPAVTRCHSGPGRKYAGMARR